MNIEENNKLIAEFMSQDQDNTLTTTGTCRYRTSWEWLMPVQKKIGEIYSQDAQRLHFEKGDLFDDMQVYLFNGQIEEHYKAVVEFIKWYNENKFICGSCGDHCGSYEYNEETDVDECPNCQIKNK